MSIVNGSQKTNGTKDDVELKLTANGYHEDLEHHVEDASNGFPLVGNGIANLALNANSSKLKPDFDSHECLPFPLLPGEYTEQRTCGEEANIILTNYRLFVCMQQCFYNIPVRCIEYVEMRELLGLHVNCKDGKVVRIGFDTPEECSEWWRHITSSEASQSHTEDLFALSYFKNVKPKNGYNGYPSVDVFCEASMYVNDVKRMGFNIKTIWRTTEINSKFEVCKSYPKFHIVPAWITDEDLQTVAQFRSLRRFPSVVWRNKTNGAVIARASQPELGWFGWRCEKDENLLTAIAQAANLDSNVGNLNMTLSVTDMATAPEPSFLLVDARSYAAAVANRAKGGGCECQEYYTNCDIQFMGLPNIHAIRKSFHSVRALCLLGQDQNNWYSQLEATRWLLYMSALIRSTLTIVDAIDNKSKSTLVHCSDGWDRTAQLVSLSELLLDPYYRTIKGFRVLIEREWLEFGHKFADRSGHSPDRDINERSPVFFQWLDAVHQIMTQYPSIFEFNEFFLMKLVEHVYSCLFGTFLCNNIRERHQMKLKSKSVSVWDFLLSGRKDFINYLYVPSSKVIYPSHYIKDLNLWENVFIVNTKFTTNLGTLSDLTNSIELTESGNFVANSNGNCKKNRNVRKNSKKSLTKHSNAKPNTNVVQECVKESENSISSERKCKQFNEKEIYDFNNEITDKIKNLNMGKTSNTSVDDDTTNKTLKNEEVEVNVNRSRENDGSGMPAPFYIDKTDMSDSVKTVTADTDHRKSLDDLCIFNGKGSPHTEIDHNFVTLGCITTNLRKSHSSPDSPTMTRLQRTKSVPDVMTSSIGATSDISKQYPSLEVNKYKFDLMKDYSKYIDSDGLTISYNFLDKKLIDIETRHAQELAKLQWKFDLERQARVNLQQQFRDGLSCSPGNDVLLQDDLLSLPDSVNGEPSSISSISNDEGWEQVQFDDVQPICWLPDHLSSHCSDCGCQFSLVYRRHHCRNCGDIFCDSCSNHQISVPEEQLYAPVRVCVKCYLLLKKT